MKREEVLEIVGKHREQLQQMGVKSLDLFGSVARNEAREDSDVDFFIEFNGEIGIFEFIKVKQYLEDILKVSVDIGTLDSLRENLREPVIKDVVRAF